MITKEDRPTCLIVCSDERATELGSVLELAFSVYCRSRIEGTWRTLQMIGGAWTKLELAGAEQGKDRSSAIALPSHIDVLFFHTGNNDPAGIPSDRTFTKEFAFSGGGLSAEEVPSGRASAMAIRRRFEARRCPVRPRNLEELVAFLSGQRIEIPSFCSIEQGVGLPAIVSMAILCQAYGVAGLIVGELDGQGRLAQMIKWNTFSELIRSSVADRLRAKWGDLCLGGWWLESLGISTKSESRQEFVLQILDDLELKLEEDMSDRSPAVESLAEASLGAVRDTYPGVAMLVGAIFARAAVTPAVVTACYDEIARVLEDK